MARGIDDARAQRALTGARRSCGLRAALGLALAGLVAAGLPAQAAGGTTSAEVPAHRPQSTTVVRTSTADAPVQVNVDLGMAVRKGRRCTSTLPGVCKGAVYHPCFNLKDAAYAGCQLYTLFRVLDVGTTRTDLLQGISIGSTSRARDGRTVTHGWGSKITSVDLEIYAKDPERRFGDVRMRVSEFPYVLGDTASSAVIGHLNLPQLGDPDVGQLVGRALGADGKPMPPHSFKLDAFGHENTGHKTGLFNDRSFDVYGFGGARVERGTRDGSFRTRPLWVGAYDVHVQRKGASFRCGVDVRAGQPVRLNLDFGLKNLGQPRCEPMGSLAQGVPG